MWHRWQKAARLVAALLALNLSTLPMRLSELNIRALQIVVSAGLLVQASPVKIEVIQQARQEI